MKEYFNELKNITKIIFEPFTTLMLMSTFIGGLIVFKFLVGDSFLIALRDSFIITISLLVIIILGSYIKHLENK